ncbi:methylcrotonoyl-CoA carboxylase beta chain, mitochondrial isoform X1 [Planococcus citri]|uniref:methylcrotonoyl-CoA carboxylase beta chain, mitochondrial isoform X1 n=1 Tax=Planococcus citri TaxID=170843 RepID=UPI0031FA1EBE
MYSKKILLCSSNYASKRVSCLSQIARYLRMQPINNEIDENNVKFKNNYSKMKEFLVTFDEITKQNVFNRNEKTVKLHRSRNKQMIRERIDKLIDEGTAFLELSQMAGYKMYPGEDLPSGGIVTGIGKISGLDCMIIGNDATVKGGTYYPITVKKQLRAMEIADQNGLACIYLVDSGGANVKRQAEVYADKEHFGRIFYYQALLSAKGISQIAAIVGMCTAGGAYIPSMCDESVIVKNNGTLYLAGPPLVEAATGEVVSAQELGGADLHCRTSGVTDHFAENEDHAMDIVKRIAARIKNEKKGSLVPTNVSEIPRIPPRPPLYPSHYLYGLTDVNRKDTFDVRQIIACVVDGSEFDEFKETFDENLVTGFARVNGYLTGIIANNGVMLSESAIKGAHFIQLCCQRKIPIIFLQNVTGFMVGKEYEASGIAKHGAKLITALSCAQVPKITVIIGASYGAANFAMCGRAFNPRFLFSWPNSEIAIMGGEQAANMLIRVSKLNEEEKGKLKQQILNQFQEESQAYYASARLWDDGVIDPASTRDILSLCLSICLKAPIPDRPQYGIFRM